MYTLIHEKPVPGGPGGRTPRTGRRLPIARLRVLPHARRTDLSQEAARADAVRSLPLERTARIQSGAAQGREHQLYGRGIAAQLRERVEAREYRQTRDQRATNPSASA